MIKFTLLPKKKNKDEPWFIFWLKWIGTFYICTFIFLFLFQRYLLYYPDTKIPDPEFYGVADKIDVVTVTTSDGIDLTGWAFNKIDKTPYVMVYLHGNARNHANRRHFAKLFNHMGYKAIMASYRGYAGNKGSPHEEGLYKDGRAWVDWVKETYPDHKIILYGESLGTGVTTKMAEEYDVAGVILEVPYTSVPQAAQEKYPIFPAKWVVHDQYDNLGRIKEIEEPILIMGAGKDIVLPSRHAKILYEQANEPKTLYFEEKAGHFNLYDFDAIHYVSEFVDGL